jgi:hypothetical protein
MQRVGRDVVFPDVPGWRLVLVIGVVERSAHGERHVQAIGSDGEVLDVVTVGRVTQWRQAQARGQLRFGGARRGPVTLPERGGVIVVLDERTHACHVVLVLGNLVADVEDREIDRRGIRLLAASKADAAAAGPLRTGR